MKKGLLILVALLLVGIHSVCNAQTTENKSIIIKKGTPIEIPKIEPRTPVSIICTYNDGTLHFTFYEDLGEVEITVIHSSMGNVSVSEYDSDYGCVVVPASSDSGSYLIEIITEDGTCYYGEYIL